MENAEALAKLQEYCNQKLGNHKWDFYKKNPQYSGILNAMDERTHFCDDRPEYWYGEGEDLIDEYFKQNLSLMQCQD